MSSFNEWSYTRHRDEGNEQADASAIEASLDPGTADAWRHHRAYEIAEYVGRDPGDRWLTVGDGRFGLDAIRLRRRGAGSVLPSSLDEGSLRIARERGLIEAYAVENAERLSFPDGSFDYVFCKESYHHFPRPMVALYELLRVARRGVILVEPNDRSGSAASRIMGVLKRRPHPDSQSYEDVGNFIHTISAREIEKVAIGIDAAQLALKAYNDHWIRGLEREPADLRRAPLFRRVRARILLLDVLCALGLEGPNLLMAGIFKAPIPADAARRMRASGWRIVDLPRNPHRAPVPAPDPPGGRGA
jgi:ubiquinone/menaquinone biosynthesis C-methylase UbiE